MYKSIFIIISFLFCQNSFSQTEEQLIVFLGNDSISDHFRITTLPDVQEYTEKNNIELKLISVEKEAPLEVKYTPSFFYQNYRGRSLYSGRYLTTDRLINFIRTAKYSPRKNSENKKEEFPIWETGRATIGTPIKVTPLEGAIPENFNQEKFIEDSKRAIMNGLQEFTIKKTISLQNSARLFYTDYYSYLAEDSTLYISTAIFSMFHCHKPVFQSETPISGKWKDRAFLFEQATELQEKMVKNQLHNLKWGDAFAPIPKHITPVEWEKVGLGLPARKALNQTNFQLDYLPKTWQFDKALPDGSPLLQFSFGAPVDHYSGEAKDLKMQLELVDSNSLLGAKGYVIVKASSITMGDEGLDEYIFDKYLKTGLFPNSSYEFTITKAPATWNLLEPQIIELNGIFKMMGQEVQLQSSGSVEVILDEKSQPQLRINGIFKLPIQRLFGMEGPDGPSPAKDELDFQLNFLLRSTKTISTVSKDLFESDTVVTPQNIKSQTEYIKWFASTKLYKAKGNFESWYFEELNIPQNNFEKIEAKLVIEIASISERSKLLVKHLKNEHFFDEPKFPKAYIEVDGASKNGENKYKANAKATIKGITAPIELHFEVIDLTTLEVKGSAQVERETFGIGSTYKKAKNISKVVELEFRSFLLK